MQESSVKRKRTQNTTPSQYLLYLEAMEQDYVFRSGTLDPTIEPDYIEKKWDELTIKLNSIGKGPALTKQSWQKRFKDCKNATRAKYRKIVECRNATGGGIDEIKSELTPLEERGLQVWGKVAVTGTPCVTITGGIRPTSTEVRDLSNNNSNINLHQTCNVQSTYFNKFETVTILPVPDIQENVLDENILENSLSTEPNLTLPNIKKKKTKPKTQKIRTLNETADELKLSYDQNTQVLSSLGNNFTLFIEEYRQRGKTEERKLNFKIQKYKYEHEDFVFYDST